MNTPAGQPLGKNRPGGARQLQRGAAGNEGRTARPLLAQHAVSDCSDQGLSVDGVPR
jgi:hypothetical protein